VMLRHLVTACIGPNGEISNVVNDEGGATLPNAERMPRVTAYPAPGR